MNMSLNICYYLSKFFFQTLYFDIKYDYYSTQNIIRHINKNLKISQSVKLLQHLQLQVTKNMEWHQWPRMFPNNRHKNTNK